MPDDKSMTRARQYAQSFYGQDEELLQDIGENFEYYLDHVDEFESGDFEPTDLPHLNDTDKFLIHSGVLFGLAWAHETATLYAVSNEDGTFEGLYAHPENAARHVADIAMSTDAPESMVQEDTIPVEEVSPKGVDARDKLDTFLNSENKMSREIGENLLFLFENREAFDEQEVTPDDFPNHSQNVKWVLAYAALFGRLWEFSHPGLWAVLDGDDGFVDLYGSPSKAKVRATETEGGRVQRVNPQDGGLPNDVVLGADDLPT